MTRGTWTVIAVIVAAYLALVPAGVAPYGWVGVEGSP